MNKDEFIELINANLSSHLATTPGNQPHCRGMMTYKADEQGIIFNAEKSKDLYKQILDNPLVEVCFFDPKKNIQVRVTGTIDSKDDMALKEETVQARPFLRPWVEEMGYDTLIVF